MALLADFGPRYASPDDIRLTARELRILLHEFGHCMHNLCSRTKYQHLAGTRCEEGHQDELVAAECARCLHGWLVCVRACVCVCVHVHVCVRVCVRTCVCVYTGVLRTLSSSPPTYSNTSQLTLGVCVCWHATTPLATPSRLQRVKHSHTNADCFQRSSCSSRFCCHWRISVCLVTSPCLREAPAWRGLRLSHPTRHCHGFEVRAHTTHTHAHAHT